MSKLKIAKIAFMVFGGLLLLLAVRSLWGDADILCIAFLTVAIVCFLGAYAMSAAEHELDALREWQDSRIEKLKKQLAAQEQKK